MIQQTIDRIGGFIDGDHTFVVTNALQVEAVKQQLPGLNDANILVEPIGRNTAPCIGLAAIHIAERDPDAVMIVLAADHLIRPAERFCSTLNAAVEVARTTSASVTIGIRPTRPETGYGYIQFVESASVEVPGGKAHKVKAFAEKPNEATAVRFVASGDFLWNSGMFVWKVSTFLNLVEEHLPGLYRGLQKIRSVVGQPGYDQMVADVFHGLKPISVDYGVMEKTEEVYVIKSDFDWNDVGSWLEVFELSSKDDSDNAVAEDSIAIDSSHVLVHSPGQTVALVDVHDLIIVNTGDAMLICNRHRAQDVKKVVEELERRRRTDLL